MKVLIDTRFGVASPKKSKERPHFERVRDHFRAFPDTALETADYEEAAEFFNRCRAKGIQGSNTDFLICAVAIRRDFSILTTDDDLSHFARVLPILRYEVAGK
ncbi:MAG TPA: PIN domain-containing protein [Thermoanaerobaculia bacterium]|nr:PIN domain-containing protein [Thermoanaerobaculia bacterium]